MLARLAKRGCDQASAMAAVGELERAGLMGDERYAMERAQGELARKPAADVLLEHTLTSRGVSPELAARTTRRLTQGSTEGARAIELVRTSVRAASLSKSPIAERRRLASLLARRGFDEEAAQSALESALGPIPDVEHDVDQELDAGSERAAPLAGLRKSARTINQVEDL